MPKRRRPFSAFTLLELIVVLILLSIIAALVMPSLRGFTIGQGTDDAAEQIAVLARYARTMAITDGVTYRLNFSSSDGTYWLTRSDSGVFNALTNEYGKHFSVPQGSSLRTDLTAQSDGTYVTFQPSGRSDTAHIWVSDKLGKTLEVADSSATELFRILSPQEMTR